MCHVIIIRVTDLPYDLHYLNKCYNLIFHFFINFDKNIQIQAAYMQTHAFCALKLIVLIFQIMDNNKFLFLFLFFIIFISSFVLFSFFFMYFPSLSSFPFHTCHHLLFPPFFHEDIFYNIST